MGNGGGVVVTGLFSFFFNGFFFVGICLGFFFFLFGFLVLVGF